MLWGFKKGHFRVFLLYHSVVLVWEGWCRDKLLNVYWA